MIKMEVKSRDINGAVQCLENLCVLSRASYIICMAQCKIKWGPSFNND